MQNWHLGANDPDVLGWLTTVAYLGTSVLCAWRGSRERLGAGEHGATLGLIWLAFAAVALAMGINKQLDLQTPFLAVSRELAREEGWYSVRRTVQWIVIGGGLVGGLWMLTWLWRRGREAGGWSLRLALFGLTLLLVFVAVRAAPVHADEVLNVRHPVPGKRHVIELAAIACVGIAAGKRRAGTSV